MAEAQRGEFIIDVQGDEAKAEGLGKVAAVAQHGDVAAFHFGRSNRHPGPGIGRFVLAKKEHLLLPALDANGLVLGLMAGHALHGLQETFHRGWIEHDGRAAGAGVGDDRSPVGIVALDLPGDERPAPAAELEQGCAFV